MVARREPTEKEDRTEAESGPRRPVFNADEIDQQLYEHRGSSLWLGRYSPSEIRPWFDRFGITAALHREGFPDFEIVVEGLDAFHQALRVYEHAGPGARVLVDLRARETRLPSESPGAEPEPAVLEIEWLQAERPDGSFSPARPHLPGQRRPGLGIGRAILRMLFDVARRHGLEGLVAHPERFHHAWLYGPGFRFKDPARQGLLIALRRDLAALDLAQAAWAIEFGCVRSRHTGETFSWTSSIQVLPMSSRMRAVMRSREYLEARDRAAGDAAFALDAERFDRFYAEIREESRGTIAPVDRASRDSGRREAAVSQERSINELFDRIVETHADRVAYRYKKDGTWHDLTWRQQREAVERIARSLLALGVERGDRVCILSDTRLEWVQVDFATLQVAGVTVGIYPSSLAEDAAYVADHSDAAVLFVENAAQMEKVASVRDRLPKVRHVVAFEKGVGSAAFPEVLSWEAFLARGEGVDPASVRERAAAVGPDDLASLVYTSGTTGLPKGAMITHGNIVFASWSASQCLELAGDETTLLFLPLAHVFARLVVHFSMRNAVTVAFAESILAVGDNLREVRPHFIASVPRIFEKVYDKITSGVAEKGGVKAKLFGWAIGVGRQVSALQQSGKPIPGGLAFQRKLADRLVFSKIQAALGGRMRFAVSGAAPLNPAIAEFFHACGLLILEGLGMTENTSFTNANRMDRFKFGTVGPVGPGIEMKLAADGEILFRGPNVMKGYFKSPDATAETIDRDGWLYTGDIGEIDRDGFLKITDRKKDLIITAGGKNIAPQRIEGMLKSSHFISNAMAFGDRQRYVVALVALDLDQVGHWAASHGVDVSDRVGLVSHPKVRELIDGEVARANNSLASYESVKKVRIVPVDFSVEGGELTPTLKVRRRVVVEKYRSLLDEMYRD